MKYLVGLDVGTSGAKALVVDEQGALAAETTCEYPLLTPRPNWAEQHPQDWWNASAEAIQTAIADSGIEPGQIAGVGLSGQMHGSVFLDSASEVIRPAILWCDQRTQKQCDWITEQVGETTLHEETLNPVLTGFQAPKIVWLRDNEPDNYDRVEMILLPKDYIRFRLTGEFATEVSDASGTSLLNVRTRQWSQAMLDGIGLDQAMLPEVYESHVVSGEITAEAASLTGVPEGTPVVGGGGDQAAGAVGNGIVRTGAISITTGTSGVVFAYLDEPVMDDKLRTHTFCHAVDGKWHAMGVMLSAGGSLRWMRDTLCSDEVAAAGQAEIDPYELMTQEAAQSPPAANGLIFLPYLTGERCPYPDPDARGVFFGLNLTNQKRDMIRAVMEGVAFGLRDSFDLIGGLGVAFSDVRLSGGGARSELWRQIQADILDHEVTTINVDQGAAYGAALLAAVGAGLYPDVQAACETAIETVSRLQPQPETVQTYQRYYDIYQNLYQSLKDDFSQLSSLTEMQD